jgi:hypothetical protein
LSRNAIALFAVGILGMLLVTLVNHTPSEAARMILAPVVAGLMTMTAGMFLLVRRKSLVRETVNAYERSPKMLQAIYRTHQRLYRFKTYESFAMFNIVLGAAFFLTLGLIAFGVLAYRLVRGL